MDMLLFFRTIGRNSCRVIGRHSVASLIAFLLVGWSTGANAIWALGMVPGIYIPQSYYKRGAVYTRAIVLSPAGNPYYVEYDNSGNEGREIAEKTGEYERAQIMAGAYYRSLLQRLADTKQRYPEHEEMTAAAYRGSTFKTAGGETIQKPSIASTSLTVLVRAENNRYLKDGSDLLLLELPIKSSVQPSASSQSLLLSEAGDILHQTANTIAFRVGFFGKDGKVETSKRRDHGSEIYGKMPNVVVTMGGFTPGGIAATDEDGKYRMHYFLPPCPGFTFDYTTPLYLELYYSRFNPRGSSMMPYYLVRQDYDFCNGLSAISALMTLTMPTIATPVKPNFDFPVDLMVVDGAAAFANVKLDAQTAYNPETSDYAKTIQEAYDFDGDEKPEIIVPGKKVKKTIDGAEREVFVESAVAEAELQGIYLSSRHSAKPASTEDTAPDFTRLIDTTADFKDRGLLQSISKDDLRDTDIYVFRESTGQLVAERRGLHENELYKTFSGVDDKQGSFRFTIQLRGSAENHFALQGRTGEANFNKWQSAGGFTEEFQKRTGNHLKSGEQVRIIAINRPTGYMGSARINLNASLSGNMIDLNQARIQLTPPNLKIWAERKNKIEQGMTRGEEKKQLIGNEGAGLGSDISIAIYSDWRDQDGGPLPEALADYGYTGRLAKIVAANQLAPVGANNLSQFKIKPGQQVQIIQLPEKVLAKQHLYLQVAGQPENRNPDFATGNGEGILKYRPSKYVPVQVPLHDEEASEIARQAYRKADKEKPELNLKKPEPMYSWQYRPEMQFSLYELNIKEIRKLDAKNLIDDVYQDKKPVVASSDNLLELYYDLLRSDISELDAWSYQGEKQLIFAIGEEEVSVTYGKDKTLKFDNLEHLGALDIDDYLMIRLYTNNDSGNTLLEWAFEYLSVFPDTDDDFNDGGEFYYVSADNPRVEMKALLAGYYTRKESIKKPETVVWGVEGAGSPSPQVTTSTDSGVFSSLVTMPATSGARGRVYARLQGGDANAYYKEIIVVPGEPAKITASFSGGLYAGLVGELVADINVTDRNGNQVLQGASADFRIEGEGRLVEEGASLINGHAQVKIRGARNASGVNHLVVRVGGKEERFPFSVGAFNTRLDVEDVYENTEVALSFKLEGVDMASFKPETFEVSVDKGLILDAVGKVNGDTLVYRWHTGFLPGDALVSFSDGAGQKNVQKYRVLPSLQGRLTDKRAVALVVGGNGQSIEYRRVNGTDVAVPIAKEDIVTLKGLPGESVYLRIGDQINRNRESALQIKPADMERGHIVQGGSEIAISSGFQYQLSTLDGTPTAFNLKGYPLVLLDSTALDEAAEGPGLKIDLVYESGKDGVLFAWKDLYIFEQRAGQVILKLKTADAQFEQHPIKLDATPGMQNLQLSIQGKRLDYQFNELNGSFELGDSVTPGLGTRVSMLSGQDSSLRQMQAFRRDAPPLVQVNNSTEDRTIVLDAQGRAELKISTALSSMTVDSRQVPIYIGDDQFTVSLYKTDSALHLLAAVLELRDLDLEEVKQILGSDVRSASAIAPQAVLASSIVQSADAESEKAAALFTVFSSLPEGRHLLPHKSTMLTFLASDLPSDFKRAYIDELHKVIQRRQTADLGFGYKRMLGLLVMAELIKSRPEAMQSIVQSVTDARDLGVWLNWMAMPANGWAFYAPPTPDVKQSCTEDVVYALEDTPGKVPYNPCRLTGAQFGEWLTDFISISPEFSNDPASLRDELAMLHEAMPGANYEIRNNLFGANSSAVTYFDPTSLLIQKSYAAAPLIAAPIILRMIVQITKKLAVQLGKNAARNLAKFALGKSNYRIHPMIFLLSAGYVYDQIDSGKLKTEESDASAKFWSTMRLFVARLALENGRDGVVDIEDTLQKHGGYNCQVMNFSHGNIYEIVMIAFYQAMGKKIVELDRPRKVPLYGDAELTRKPDIELQGEAGKNIWVELKSVQAGPSYTGDDSQLPTETAFLNKFPVFNAPQKLRELNESKAEKSGANEYHKQFVLDRIATYGVDKFGDPVGIAKQFHWRFQKWKPKLIKYTKPVAGRKWAGNGYPMTTGVKQASGSYLDLIKKRFAEIPTQQADFKQVLDLDKKGVNQRAFELVQIPIIFRDPVAQELLDSTDDLDEYFLQHVVSKMGYTTSDIEKIRSYANGLDAIQQRLEVVTDWFDKLKEKLHLDIEDKLVEKAQEILEEQLEKLDLGGSCESRN
jgi:hypothetical protein